MIARAVDRCALQVGARIVCGLPAWLIFSSTAVAYSSATALLGRPLLMAAAACLAAAAAGFWA